MAELPLQYADFAVWQRRLLETPGLVADHVGYWTARLADAPPPLALPWRRRNQHGTPDVVGSRQSLLLMLPERTAQLKTLARREGTTTYMTLLAAFLALLSRATGQDDLLVGSYFAYRNQSEFEGVLGFRTNLGLLRTDLSGDPPFLELIRRVRAVYLAAAAHQDVPFTELTRALAAGGGTMPSVQVMFQYVRTDHAPLCLAGAWAGRLHGVRRAMPAGFSLNVVERMNQRTVAAVDLDTTLYDPVSVGETLREFRALIEEIVLDPTRRLSELLPG